MFSAQSLLQGLGALVALDKAASMAFKDLARWYADQTVNSLSAQKFQTSRWLGHAGQRGMLRMSSGAARNEEILDDAVF